VNRLLKIYCLQVLFRQLIMDYVYFPSDVWLLNGGKDIGHPIREVTVSEIYYGIFSFLS